MKRKIATISIDEKNRTIIDADGSVPIPVIERALKQAFVAVVEQRVRLQCQEEAKTKIINPHTGGPAMVPKKDGNGKSGR